MTDPFRTYWQGAYRTLVPAGLALAVALALPPFQLFEDRAAGMLQTHLLLELFSVIVSAMIVSLAWHELDPDKSSGTGILAAGFMAVAALDLVHALTYDGMPALVTASSTPRAIFFWLAGRSLAMLTLLLLALDVRVRLARHWWTAFSLGLFALLFCWGTFAIDAFPLTYVVGQGVTPFKTGFEYALVLLYGLTAGAFIVRATPATRGRSHSLATACLLLAMGELVFAHYRAPSDFLNNFGHLYKVLAYAVLYRTMFVAAVRTPLLQVRAAEVELRRASAELERQSGGLQSTFANMSQGIVLFDANGRLSLYNQRYAELLGFPQALLQTLPLMDELVQFQARRGDFDGPGLFPDPRTHALARAGKSTSLDNYVRRTRDGRTLEVKTSWLADGSMVRTFADVSAYVEINDALREERERLDRILDGTRAGTWELNIASGESKFNERWAEIVGYRLEQLPRVDGSTWRALVEPEDLPRAVALMEQAFRREIDFYECEFRMRHKDGYSVWVLARGKVQRWSEDGKPLIVSGIHLDISDLKRTEEALIETSAELIEQSRLLQSTLESISQGIVMMGEDGRVSIFNRQVCAMLDLPESLYAARPTMQEITRYQIERGDFGHDMSLVEDHARDYVAASGEGQSPDRYLRRTKAGRVLEVVTRSLGSGSLVRTFSDVTQYFETREALVASEARARVITESAHDAILMADARGIVTYANPAAEACFGYPEGALDGQPMGVLIPQHHWQTDGSTMQAFAAEGGHRPRRLVTQVLGAERADGSRFPVEASVAQGVVGEDTVVSVIVRDISERLALEERSRALSESLERRVAERTLELERSMKDMEAISYSMAHDLRAPLRSVNGFAAILQRDEHEQLSPHGRELFQRIVTASRNMGSMIDDLLGLFRVVRAPLLPQPVAMATLAREAADALGPSAPGCRIDIGAMPDTHGDVTLLRQLVFNLVDNALKYSRGVEAPHVEIGHEPVSQAYWVRDNGVGFDMAYAAKLFGVFQRLHGSPEIEGSGVGLSIVARIVERHGGRIWAESAPGRGATFRFTLAAGPSTRQTD